MLDKKIDFNVNIVLEDDEKIAQLENLYRDSMILNAEDIEILLRNLVSLVRSKIADYEGVNDLEYSYYNKCDLAQSMMYYYLNKLGVNVNLVNTNDVIQGVCGHSIIIATFETVDGEKTFLIDPTYIQFFDKKRCDDSRFVIINDIVCIAPDPGFFVVKDNNADIILPLLENGYIEFTEEVAKVYGDSFFQTKQGTLHSQINNNRASGSSYIKWFKHYTSSLSKKEEELEDMNLSIDLVGSKTIRR